MASASFDGGDEQLRIDASDGQAYPLSSFLEVYGSTQGRLIWNAATPFDLQLHKKAKNDVPPAEGTNAEDESQTKKKRARVEDPTTNEPAVVERPQGNKASTGAVASSAQGTPSNVPTAIDKILTMTASSSLNCRILHQAVFQDNSKGAGSAAAAAAKSAQEGQRCHVLTPDVCLGPGTAPISSNFLRGLKFSPDGLCILTNSEDTTLRVFDLFAAQPVETEAASHDASPSDGNQNASQTARKGAAPWDPVLEMHEGGMVYDFDWYPFMDSQHPATWVLCMLTS